MRLRNFGSFVAALSVAEWLVLAALVVLFGKRTLVVAMTILRLITVAFAAVAAALFVIGTVAFVVATR